MELEIRNRLVQLKPHPGARHAFAFADAAAGPNDESDKERENGWKYSCLQFVVVLDFLNLAVALPLDAGQFLIAGAGQACFFNFGFSLRSPSFYSGLARRGL